jgi:hypothetical protein
VQGVAGQEVELAMEGVFNLLLQAHEVKRALSSSN